MSHRRPDLVAWGHKGGRALSLVIVSVAIGALFGAMAGARCGVVSAPTYAMMGAVAGLVAAPAFVWGMWYEPLGGGVAIVMSAAAGTALAIGSVDPSARPLAVLAATIVYVCVSIAFGVRTRERRDRRIRRVCAKCEYPLAGLRDPICPECGTRTGPRRDAGFRRTGFGNRALTRSSQGRE